MKVKLEKPHTQGCVIRNTITKRLKLWKMEAVTMKAATMMNLIAKLLKQVTIYIRSIKTTKTPRRYALRSRPY
jgi:hypothetical protein